jgi:hypothetical protein
MGAGLDLAAFPLSPKFPVWLELMLNKAVSNSVNIKITAIAILKRLELFEVR